MTCDAILEATARILPRVGLQDITTNEIAELAGVSIGSLYQYYPSKDVIVAELIRNMRAGMLEDILEADRAARDLGLADTTRLLIGASMRHHRPDPALARVLEMAERSLPMDAENEVLKGRILAVVVAALTRHGITGPEQSAQDLVAITNGIVDAAVAADERDFDQLEARVVRAAIGYLAQG